MCLTTPTSDFGPAFRIRPVFRIRPSPSPERALRSKIPHDDRSKTNLSKAQRPRTERAASGPKYPTGPLAQCAMQANCRGL